MNARLQTAFGLLFLFGAPSVLAQDVDCNNIPTMAIAEPAEYAQCHHPMVVETPVNLGAAPAFGINLRAAPHTFISFDYSNAAGATVVGATTATNYYAGDFAGDSFGSIYAISDANAFVSINTATGVATPIGTSTPPAGQSWSGMTWDYTTSSMYVISNAAAGGAATLGTVNLATGAVTPGAAVTVAGALFINLMAHPTTGVLYSVDLLADNTYSINKTTGVATLLGPTGYLMNFAQGGDFDNATNVAYICAYQGGGVNTLRSVDLTTGATTAVGTGFTNMEVDFCASTNPFVPVELTSFTGTADGTSANLAWTTASETNNAGFEVQALRGGDWTNLGFVEGHGTTTEAQSYSFRANALSAGTHVFRLRQVDFDGAVEYHGEVEVTVGVPGTHTLSAAYPNPFNPQSQFDLSVASTQPVRVELFNALGQRVATLFNGQMEGGAVQQIRVDGSQLASGLYVARVTGATFSDTITLSLLK